MIEEFAPFAGEFRSPMPAPMPTHGKAHILIRRLLNAGMPATVVSRASSCTVRYVRRIKAQMRAERADMRAGSVPGPW